MKFNILSIIALFASALFVSCQSKDKEQSYFKESGERFHTTYHITYQHDKALTAEIDSVFDAFNAVLNPFDSASLISKFNRNESNELHPMLRDVILQAQEISRITDGIYDITGSPLFDIWGFGTKKGVTRKASQEEIDSIMAFVGYEKLVMDSTKNILTKTDPRLYLNPSSLSKGYVTDLVARELERHGIVNYLVEIGGEIVVSGVNPDGKCWKIGINKPIPDNQSVINEVLFALPICEKTGLASSGDYRNFKDIEGLKVAHTINACTGYPALQNILSATVIAPTSMEADAWATALMALGLEQSIELLKDLPHLKVCLIYADPETNEFRTYEKGVEIIEIKQ